MTLLATDLTAGAKVRIRGVEHIVRKSDVTVTHLEGAFGEITLIATPYLLAHGNLFVAPDDKEATTIKDPIAAANAEARLEDA